MKLALDEILTNVISYAYDDAGEHHITIRFSLEQGKWTVEVEDDGRPFNPSDAPEAEHEAIAGRASDRRFGNSSRAQIDR